MTYRLALTMIPKKLYHQFNIGKKFLKQFDLRDKTILDLGCGTGNLTFLMKGMGAKKIIGIDIKEKSIKKAKEYLKELNLDNIIFKVMDAHKITLNEKFDIVFCNIAFHHFSNQLKVIQKVYKVMKKEGIFLITTSLKGYKNEFHQIKKDILKRPPFRRFKTEPSSKKKINEDELRELLEEAKFREIKIHTETIPCQEKDINMLLEFYRSSPHNHMPSSMPTKIKEKAWNEVKKELLNFYKDKPKIVHWKIIFAVAKK